MSKIAKKKPQHDLIKISKFLSLVLRHRPDMIHLTLDPQGWTSVDELIAKARPRMHLTRELIEQTVMNNDKQRFALSEDGQRIRANQGHSIAVDLQLKPQVPSAVLYHGTTNRFLKSILQDGLKSRQRQYVHLSKDIATAVIVGRRHGEPVILQVDAAAMHEQGCEFFLSENGVWLTDHVPPQFLSIINACQ